MLMKPQRTESDLVSGSRMQPDVLWCHWHFNLRDVYLKISESLYE